jgi:formate-dependent nitrite reductase membrane component NrfD
MIVGWLIVAVIKSFFHMADLYHPLRAFRMLARPQSSWISRGLIITFVFLIAAFTTIILDYSNMRNPALLLVRIVSVLAAVALSIYPGFVLRSAKGIQVWRSMWIPIIFLGCGLLGGIGVIKFIGVFDVTNVAKVSYALFYTLIGLSSIAMIGIIYHAYHVGEVGRVVTRKILVGSLRYWFWLGIVFAGVLTPFSLLIVDNMVKVSPAVFLLSNSLSALVFGICTVFIILKIGIYEPLV